MKNKNLEATGHSWSGIADAVRYGGVDKHALACEINQFYKESKENQIRLEKELEQAKLHRGIAVSDFIYLMKTCDGFKDDFKLCFTDGDEAVTIKLLDYNERRIDYDSHVINLKPEL